jgi:hypothetical protein
MNFTNYPDSNRAPPGGRLLTDTDIVEMLRRAGAPPYRPEKLHAIGMLRSLINFLACMRPKSEAERQRRQERTTEGSIVDGCTMAIKGIVMVLDGIHWLTDELTDDEMAKIWAQTGEQEQRTSLIATYERAKRKLTETRCVLDELAAIARKSPLNDRAFNVKRADPGCLGAMHGLYELITGDTKLSKVSSAVRFIAVAMKEIGWEYPKAGKDIEQVLLRQRKRRKQPRPVATNSMPLNS